MKYVMITFYLFLHFYQSMSDIVLQKSKILCYFTIDSSLPKIDDELMQPLMLPLTIYHFHYPPAYYPTLFQHFKHHFPVNITENHLCLKKNGKQLPAELPLGLQIDNNDLVQVAYRQFPIRNGFNLIMASWKKGYTIVNKEGGCDHVFKKLNQNQQKQLYRLHLMGKSHGLHKIPKYQGNCIALKIYCQGTVIERKEERLDLTLREYLEKFFAGVFNREAGVFTHGVKLDLKVWNYNDGYCYLKMVQ